MKFLQIVCLFFQDQVLGTKWLSAVIGNLLSLLGLDVTGRVGGSIQFFIYDVLKIAVMAFCSCSTIALFIGFTNAGLPQGVTFSFLIFSPVVDLGSPALLMSIFGEKVAIVYVVVGLVIAVVGGMLIEKLHM